MDTHTPFTQEVKNSYFLTMCIPECFFSTSKYMNGLSFDKTKNARAVAIVQGGDMDGQILYLHEKEAGTAPKKKEIPAHKYQAVLNKFPKRERVMIVERLQEALDNNKELNEDEPKELKDLLIRIKGDMETTTEVELPATSQFQLIPSPSPTKRDVFYIVGQSGSGKSHIARAIAEGYRQLFPGREIYLLSKLMKDETLDNTRGGAPKRINIETLLESPPDIEEFRDCMVIADDFDALPKAQHNAVMTLIYDICITGRHTNTSLCYLSHHITDYKKTRLILNELTHAVVYPQTTSKHALKYLLETHLGVDSDIIKKLRTMGRWVAFGKNIPPYCISSHYACLVNQD
jgi:hypothetical protein